MSTQFQSKALEANLAETRYRDIYIPEEHQNFIKLSNGYYGIKKRANDCITEYHHPLSNRTFVIEELRKILITDFWFYTREQIPVDALNIPVQMMGNLLITKTNQDLRLIIINTLFELIDIIFEKSPAHKHLISNIFLILNERFEENKLCYILCSKHLALYLDKVAQSEEFSKEANSLVRLILSENYNYWQRTSAIEDWLKKNRKLLDLKEVEEAKKTLGTPFFESLKQEIEQTTEWNKLSNLPVYDTIAERFADATNLFSTFIRKFHFIFYLLHLPGMSLLYERMIWSLDKMIRQAVDELYEDEVIPFIDTIFDISEELRAEHMSAVLDFQLTLGLKIIDIDKTEHKEFVNHVEKKLISFGFCSPGAVFVDEDWQLSVNANHIKNIRVWLQLIEYSQSLMEKLLSALIVNLQLGGIFISDTDLFQREITKILNSNITPYYKKVKQLTRIFPVYFNEIGAEGEIRKVTTNMDEILGRQDKLIHFLRKQVHTESNNTLIGLTKSIFLFWYNGNIESLRNLLPDNVYQYVDTKSTCFVHVHRLLNEMAVLNNNNPERLLLLSHDEFDEQLIQVAEKIKMDKEILDRERERLQDIRDLYAHLREKYSFESVNIVSLLRRYPFIPEDEVVKFEQSFSNRDFEQSLKLIYSFMDRLKKIIFDPAESESWENIYHKRHIAIGIPSMYGVYRENKFEALGLTFRLERVATQMMEKVVANINLDYISARTLEEIYVILEYFREGLGLDGITNQSFNSKLEMLRYSLTSRSFSFDQYINIFQFIAEDIRRIIIKHFLKSYEYPLKIVIPQLFDPENKLKGKDLQKLISMKSEAFHRDVIAEAFLVQPLDNFITRILQSLRQMSASLDSTLISDIMTYNSELLISPFHEKTPKMDNQVFLGSKAYHLKNLYLAGLPVPPGFVITTEVFRRNNSINAIKELKKEIHDMVRKYISQIENVSGLKFGDSEKPLLFSVRSGTTVSMPGAMDTFLNVGLNDKLVEEIAKNPKYSWSIWDSYRRFLQSWGMGHGIERDVFDLVMNEFKQKHNVKQKVEFEISEMREIAMAYRKVLKENKVDFQQDLFEQLIQCVNMVFDSWSSERAYVYRRHLQISDNWGTAVIVQQMIFGNLSNTSGTGVVFTQNPQRERPGVHLYGDFTMRSQGEDIVGGLVKPFPVGETQRKQANIETPSMQTTYPAIYRKIYSIATELTENLGYSPQEIEFTFESDKPEDLHILQIRDQDLRLEDETNTFVFTPSRMLQIGQGIGIGGGALNGLVAFDDEDLQRLKTEHPKADLILIRPDTVPDDIGMIFECNGLLTARGGATSHAAVTAVRLGKICVVNCAGLNVNEENKTCELNGHTLKSGDKIAIDGDLGNVYEGNYPIDKTVVNKGYNY